jgi:Fe-S-cluster-containing dehydrogenase component
LLPVDFFIRKNSSSKYAKNFNERLKGGTTMPQLGWLIDLDKCTGCETCTVACKSENNTRPLSSVVKQEKGVYPRPSLTFVTSGCNHCEHPACLASCPVSDVDDTSNENNAIFKRATDGIVLINQDVCIGCKNCIQTCPYGTPQFNTATAKVEKCTFCLHRLEAGFLPACVTTCVGNALHLVNDFNSNESGMNAPDGFANPLLTKPSVKFSTGQP